MPIACWIPKATNTHSQYVLVIALPLQQWLHERASMSRYTYTACPVTVHILQYICYSTYVSKISSRFSGFNMINSERSDCYKETRWIRRGAVILLLLSISRSNTVSFCAFENIREQTTTKKRLREKLYVCERKEPV